MEVQLTTHTAIPAGSLNLFFIRGQMIFMRVIHRNQSPDRTGLETFSAEYTITFLQGTISRSHDLGFRASVSLADSVVYLDFVTGLNTSAAENTPGEVPGDKGINVFKGVGGLFGFKSSGFHTVFYGECLKTTLPISRADLLVLIPFQPPQLQIGPIIGVHVLDQAIVVS
jgi:hypothetical protein